MTLQDLAVIAAVVKLAVIACACIAGLLLARHMRFPGWAAAASMLLITRSITMVADHAWAAPSASVAFPVVDVVVGALAATFLTRELWLARRPHAARITSVDEIAAPIPVPESHADAA